MVGIAVAVLVMLAGMFFLIRRRRRKRAQQGVSFGNPNLDPWQPLHDDNRDISAHGGYQMDTYDTKDSKMYATPAFNRTDTSLLSHSPSTTSRHHPNQLDIFGPDHEPPSPMSPALHSSQSMRMSTMKSPFIMAPPRDQTDERSLYGSPAGPSRNRSVAPSTYSSHHDAESSHHYDPMQSKLVLASTSIDGPSRNPSVARFTYGIDTKNPHPPPVPPLPSQMAGPINVEDLSQIVGRLVEAEIDRRTGNAHTVEGGDAPPAYMDEHSDVDRHRDGNGSIHSHIEAESDEDPYAGYAE